ncbi:MAG TPA: hypothetical protein VGF28_06085 [Thermoanaerobaculia bacterium]
MTMLRLVSSAALLFLFVSCTTIPARTVPCDASDEANNCQQFATKIDSSVERLAKEPEHRAEVEKATFEHHTKDGFMVGFVEFDDQGWIFNHEQLEAVQRHIEAAVKVNNPPARPAIIVSFTHGWRHTAAACDRDAVCFREVLRGLAVYETERARLCTENAAQRGRTDDPLCLRRDVIGVMTGWRGAPISQRARQLENLNVASFYSSKRRAHLIGQSGYISTLIGWLNQLDDRLPENSRLILAGHSFGGAMLFSSVAGVLNQQVAEERYRPGRDLMDCNTFKPAGVGDLIVLLNPAFEALRYSSIDDRTNDLKGCRSQRTVMLTLASETDRYNGFWFSAGRRLATMFHRFPSPKQRTQAVRAVGHFDAFRTHTLNENQSANEKASVYKASEPGPCNCKYQVDEAAMKQLAADVARDPLAGYGVAAQAGGCTAPSCLEEVEGKERHNPFKVVEVDESIINGHSDIYNSRILDFLVRAVSSAADPRVSTDDRPAPPPAP